MCLIALRYNFQTLSDCSGVQEHNNAYKIMNALVTTVHGFQKEGKEEEKKKKKGAYATSDTINGVMQNAKAQPGSLPAQNTHTPSTSSSPPLHSLCNFRHHQCYAKSQPGNYFPAQDTHTPSRPPPPLHSLSQGLLQVLQYCTLRFPGMVS